MIMDAEEALISVIVPVYNGEKEIAGTIGRLLDQSHRNTEIIIVNDGSTDNTAIVCEKLKESDNRIILFNKENGGVSSARNAGLSAANGDFIAFVDGDDLPEYEYLQVLLKGFEKENADLSVCGFYVEYPGKTLKSDDRGVPVLLNRENTLERMYHFSGYQGYLWNKMFKRSVINEYNIRFNSSIAMLEDLLFCTEYVLKGRNVFYNPVPLYHYVYHENSVCFRDFNGREFQEKWFSEIKALDLIAGEIAAYPHALTSMRVHKITSCATLLRLMNLYGARKKYSAKYNECFKYVRNNIKSYIHYKPVCKNYCFSALLCALSPQLELCAWRIGRKRRG